MKGFSTISFGIHHKFDYYAAFDSRPPTHSTWLQSSNLWFDTSKRKWMTHARGSWGAVPPISEQYRGFNTTYPALRLRYDANDAHPTWIYSDSKIQLRLNSLQVACSANKWLLTALELWLRQDMCQPNIEDVFNVLLEHPLPLQQFPCIDATGAVTSKSHPSFDRAMVSLKSYCHHLISSKAAGSHITQLDINDSVNLMPNISVPDFLKHYENASQSKRALSLLGVPVSDERIHAENSLSQVAIDLPLFLRDDGNLHREPKGQNEFECSYVMAGCYTDPHQDSYVTSQYIVHIGGAKIWFRWPMNEQNRSIALDSFLTGSGACTYGSIAHAIKVLDSMAVRLVRDPLDIIILHPGELHAVITLERSCHLGAVYVGHQYFESGMALLDFWVDRWNACWVGAGTATPHQMQSLTHSELMLSTAPREISNSLCAWSSFLKRWKRPDSESLQALFSQKVAVFLNSIQGRELLNAPCKEDIKLLKKVAKGLWNF